MPSKPRTSNPKPRASASPRRSPGARAPDEQESPTKAEATRQQILLVAASLFREKGYKATTLRDVAERAGMGAGSLYYHFDSKDAILREVLEVGIATIDEAVRAAVASLPEGASPETKLREAIRADLRALLEASEYTPAYARIYNQLPATVKRRDHPRRLAYIDYWRSLVKSAQRAGELRNDLPVDVFVEFLVGSMSRATEWFHPEMAPVDTLANWVADWVLNGVGISTRKADAAGMSTSTRDRAAAGTRKGVSEVAPVG